MKVPVIFCANLYVLICYTCTSVAALEGPDPDYWAPIVVASGLKNIDSDTSNSSQAWNTLLDDFKQAMANYHQEEKDIASLLTLSYGVLMQTVLDNENKLSTHKTVYTENGLIRGRLGLTYLKNKPYYAFKGIPYAQPPIGELRFRPPKPAVSWAPLIIDAFEYGPSCMMLKEEYDLNKPMDEDCLFINVFVPVVNTTSKLPVLLHIFGGANRKNSGDEKLCMPDFLLDHEIIVVTFNYRIGPFGFMSLDTLEYPGNMGLKDQQLVIKWVSKNIEHFNGDNTKITLSGHSSGGIAATYHVINEESRKYFQRVIPMSGSALHQNSYHSGNHECLMYAIAKNASQSVQNKNQLIEFLKQTPAMQIQNFIDENVELPFPMFWNPVIEKKEAIQPFLTEDPIKAYKSIESLNLSSLITYTNREALFFETSDSLEPELVRKQIDQLEFYLPIHEFNLTYAKRPYLRPILSKVKNFFLSDITSASTDEEIADKYEIIKSYLGIGYTTDKVTQIHVEKSIQPTYLIRFSVHDAMMFVYGPSDYRRSIKGAGHAEDMCYLFMCNLTMPLYDYAVLTKDSDPFSAVYLNTIHYMSSLVSNFVKYGDPGAGGDLIQGYRPVKLNEVNFLDVSSDGLSVGQWPNGYSSVFLDFVIPDVIQLMSENESEPPTSEFDIVCHNLAMRNIN